MYKQSAADWCLEYTGPQLGADKRQQLFKELKIAVDLPSEETWPSLQEAGIPISCLLPDMGTHPIRVDDAKPHELGFCDPRCHEHVEAALMQSVDDAIRIGCPNVLAFVGYKTAGIHRRQAGVHCVNGFKKSDALKKAGDNNVTVCLEMLNSIHPDETMQGHPLYQGDSTDFVDLVISTVDSPALKMALDVYHLSVMGEEPGARIRHLGKDKIGIVHTAGRVSDEALTRCPLNAHGQLVCYRSVAGALQDIEYDGYVCHEFIYHGIEPGDYDATEKALSAAIRLCK